MPLYEYQCDACGHRFEAIQKFSDAPLEQCPKCQGALRKLQPAPAFQFKGTGWYVTDYAKKDGGQAKPDGGKSESPGSSDGKTDQGTGNTGEKKADKKADTQGDKKTDKAGEKKTETKSGAP